MFFPNSNAHSATAAEKPSTVAAASQRNGAYDVGAAVAADREDQDAGGDRDPDRQTEPGRCVHCLFSVRPGGQRLSVGHT